MTPNEIKNVRTIPADRKAHRVAIVENLQLLGLGLTIIGQVLVRFDMALVAQSLWLAANAIALGRDFYLDRPWADKIKNASLLALTAALVISLVMDMIQTFSENPAFSRRGFHYVSRETLNSPSFRPTKQGENIISHTKE